MKTSSTNSERIEAYLLGHTTANERLLFEAQLLVDAGLADELHWQEKTYQLVRNYARRQLKTEIDAVHATLFTAPEHAGFRQRLRAIFSKK